MHKAIIIFGPTAVGKTALLATLAQHSIEIISADSRQVYHDLPIATAHPPRLLCDSIPHHLVDILPLTAAYTIADFVTRAQELIRRVCARGATPIVSGGTAYYLHHLQAGLPATPPSNPAVRDALRAECETLGLDVLYNRLCAKDARYAKRIAPTDTQRIIRALEIINTTGGRVSDLMQHEPSPCEDISYTVVGVRRDKNDLHHRIETRVDDMWVQGLEHEVRSAYMHGLRMRHNAARTIGVQEFLCNERVTTLWHKHPDAALTGDDTSNIRALIIRNTKQYAKRQYTFFKRFDNVRWFDLCADNSDIQRAGEAIAHMVAHA